MGDGSISMADGLGLKVVDSNELRRKIRGPTPTHQNLSTSKIVSLGSAVVDGSVTPLKFPPENFDSLPNHSSELPFIYQTSEHSESLKLNVSGDLNLGSTVRSTVPSVSPTEFGEFSPNSATKSGPSQNLQQVFEHALIREEEDRATHLHFNASPFKCHQEQVQVLLCCPAVQQTAADAVLLCSASTGTVMDFYPERLGKLFIVHVPYIFMSAWKAVYPFIDKKTKKKIIFVEDKNLKSTLPADIDDSLLPETYGGRLPLVPIRDC
ncbi:hypothetical protein RHMOL_Rhmol12G0106200 [Rhododendron molle]|uniref:Uncharacterized protein n=1 Tax=Rhododendron molle TaxID=49168 RepID=A0ACC0LHV9_RHOML|nr:hypothetical protein RHMOL_Rhmol12G0106200 [Rhododendron molle]